MNISGKHFSRFRIFYAFIFLFFLMSALPCGAFAQQEEAESAQGAEAPPDAGPQPQDQDAADQQETVEILSEPLQTELIPDKYHQKKPADEEEGIVSKNVTLDFKEADIRNVLKIISYKAGVNIVTTPEVIGNVTVRLVDVPWEKALDVILKTYGFGYEKQANIILVAPIEKLTAQKKQEVELAQVQPTATEVFYLKYIDAQDAKKALDPQLSSRGKITILEMTGQAGWEFGGSELGKRKRESGEKMSRSKVLIVSDIPPVLDKIKEVVKRLDVRPQQVMIETRIMEVSTDWLKDIGFDFGTGTSGATSTTASYLPLNEKGGTTLDQIAGFAMGSQVAPAGFGPKATSIGSTASTFNTGLRVLYQKLTGTEFQAMLHAIEEDVHTNTLSAPTIMALNNQEATILVGTRYPILKQDTTSSSSSATVTTVSLDYYQDIGIQLNVVPQIGANNYINMVVHPAVTSYTQTLGGSSDIAKFPIIETREAETRVMLADGETIVIGGLLKDIKTKNRQGIPFLSKIPLLGIFFSRETVDTGQVDLLIFITAHVVKEGEFTSERLATLEERMDKGADRLKKDKKKKKK